MNIGNLFNSPAQLLIVLLVILLLFGASRLPNTARQLGRSMRIFKSEMKEMQSEGSKDAKSKKADEDDDESVSRIEALEGRVVDDRGSTRDGATVREGSDVDRDR